MDELPPILTRDNEEVAVLDKGHSAYRLRSVSKYFSSPHPFPGHFFSRRPWFLRPMLDISMPCLR